jgi:hypothetical protein
VDRVAQKDHKPGLEEKTGFGRVEWGRDHKPGLEEKNGFGRRSKG